MSGRIELATERHRTGKRSITINGKPLGDDGKESPTPEIIARTMTSKQRDLRARRKRLDELAKRYGV